VERAARRAAIEFLEAEKLHPADFEIGSAGVARLDPQWAQMVVAGIST
jgi:hypothetical protein